MKILSKEKTLSNNVFHATKEIRMCEWIQSPTRNGIHLEGMKGLDEMDTTQQLTLNWLFRCQYLQHNPNKLSWLPSNLHNTEILHFSQNGQWTASLNKREFIDSCQIFHCNFRLLLVVDTRQAESDYLSIAMHRNANIDTNCSARFYH